MKLLVMLMFMVLSLNSFAQSIPELLNKAIAKDTPAMETQELLQSILYFTTRAPKALKSTEINTIFTELSSAQSNELVLLIQILNESKNTLVMSKYAQILNSNASSDIKYYILESLLTVNVLEFVKTEEDKKEILGKIKESMEKNLDHDDLGVRVLSIRGLGAFGDKTSVELLINSFAKNTQEVNMEIVKTLFYMDSEDILTKYSKEKGSSVAMWSLETLNAINGFKRDQETNELAQQIVTRFILGKFYIGDEEGEDLVKEIKSSNAISPVMVAKVASYSYAMTGTSEFDGLPPQLCIDGYEVYARYPEEYRDPSLTESINEQYKFCKFFFVEKDLIRAKHYLSWGELNKNPNSAKAGVALLRKVIDSTSDLKTLTMAKILLIKGLIIKNELKEVEDLFNDLSKLELNKKQKKEVSKLNKKFTKKRSL